MEIEESRRRAIKASDQKYLKEMPWNKRTSWWLPYAVTLWIIFSVALAFLIGIGMSNIEVNIDNTKYSSQVRTINEFVTNNANYTIIVNETVIKNFPKPFNTADCVRVTQANGTGYIQSCEIKD